MERLLRSSLKISIPDEKLAFAFRREGPVVCQDMVAPNRLFLALECAILFFLIPVLLYMHPTRLNVHISLWLVAAYAAIILHKTPGFSWRREWNGMPWNPRDLKLVTARFIISTIGILFLTHIIQPERLFSFPLHRPGFWLVVMILYPILSALPQEFVFRSFFFRRYAALFPEKWMKLAVSALIFGFIHIVFHNPISPLLSVLCGFFLASSYLEHNSLKRVTLEHALYGDMVFTIGLGLYFLVHTS